MKRFLSHLFLSHKKNGFAPRLLSEVGAAVLFIIIICLFVVIGFQKNLFIGQQNSAAVYASALTLLANQDRAGAGLPALVTDPRLEKAALAKAQDMINRSYFAHYAPDGTSPWYWISQAGYSFVYAGENLAIDFSDSSAVNQAWLNSPLHRANIMNGRYTHVGIAVVDGIYEGRQTTFVVQMFGSSPEGEVTPVVATVAKPKKAEPNVVAVTGASTTPATTPIAVKNEEWPVVEATTAVLGAAENISQNPLAVPATSPRMILALVYDLIGILLLIVFGSILRSGFKSHNVRHVSYGLILVLIMVGLWYTVSFFVNGSIL